MSDHAGFTISTDTRDLDLDTIYRFLSQDAYWAHGRSREQVERSIANSALCVGLYAGDPARGAARQVGFARLVSDLATYAWLCDVFVLPETRGRGLGKWMIESVVDLASTHGIPRILLATRDAHGLYAGRGFVPLPQPERFMSLTLG
jgi:GNAT superfamily N-acetyltransferase